MEENNQKKWYELDRKMIGSLLVVLIGVAFYLLLTHLPQVGETVGKFFKVLTPFIAGFAIAYLLSNPAKYLEQKVFGRIKKAGSRKGLSVASVYLLAVLIIYILLQLVIPQFAESVKGLINNLPNYMNNLDKLVNDLMATLHLNPQDGLVTIMDSYDKLLEQATSFLANYLPNLMNMGRTVGSNIVSGIVTSITAIIASIYMLTSSDKLFGEVRKFFYALLPHKAASKFFDVLGRSNHIFSGFITGKLLDSAIMGVLCFITASLLRIPYAILISVIVGVTNIIPFFGPIIGAVPCVMILLMVDVFAALRFCVLIVALQQFDGNILGPKILGDSTGLSSFWVLVAIVVGGGLFSFPGMILGVPTFAVIYSLLRDWANRSLAQKGIDAAGNPLPAPKPQQEEKV